MSQLQVNNQPQILPNQGNQQVNNGANVGNNGQQPALLDPNAAALAHLSSKDRAAAEMFRKLSTPPLFKDEFFVQTSC